MKTAVNKVQKRRCGGETAAGNSVTKAKPEVGGDDKLGKDQGN
jgi:hypothetical protein